MWRRLVLPDTLTFWDLHFALRLAFGWENAHLFEFSTGRGSSHYFLSVTPPVQPGEEAYLPEWWRDPRQVAVSEILRAPKDKVSYPYDLGDYWQHQLVVEKAELLEALAEKAAGQRKRMPGHLSGLGKYDPEAAELAIVNDNLLHLPTIVAEENAFIEEYRRQLPPRPPRPTPQQVYDALLAGVQRLLPPSGAPPSK